MNFKKASHYHKILIYFFMMIFPELVLAGGGLSRSSKSSHLKENIYGNNRFEFIITATNIPGLSEYATQYEEGGLAGILMFAFNPVEDSSLIDKGFLYSGRSTLEVSGSSNPRILQQCSYLFGRQRMTYQIGEDQSARELSGNVMPVWGLAHFLSNPETIRGLQSVGFIRPARVCEPSLIRNNLLQADFLGRQRMYNSDVIHASYAFGNTLELLQEYSVSVSNEVVLNSMDVASLSLNQQPLPSRPSITSNAASLMALSKNDDFFLLIGLTRSGRWGLLVMVVGNLYIEGIRKELYTAMKQGRKDFDEEPPEGGAAGFSPQSVY